MKKGFWVIVKETIAKADVVLEILDARMPEVTSNKIIEDYADRCGKLLIMVINKADLVSPITLKSINERYAHFDHVIVSSKNRKGIVDLINMIKHFTRKNKIKVAVIGYPNTGKSTLINLLSRGGRAGTSPESGFTKSLQLIGGKKGLMLFDTPGVVPFEQRDEIRLGLVSGISPSKLKDPELVAYELIDIFKMNNPSAIENVYEINMDQEADEILVEIGKKMNMLKKHGLVDERRAAIHLLNDWHKGKIKL